MEMFEKVEKLRERANVTYEEAREALDICNGDLLDAMVYLEKNGKVKGPKQSTYSTDYEKQEQYVSVEDTVKSQNKSESFFTSIKRTVRNFIDNSRGNYFCARKDGDMKLQIPVLLFILIVILGWQIVIPAIIVMLFLGFHFSLEGKDEMAQANEFLNKASDFADQVKDDFTKEK